MREVGVVVCACLGDAFGRGFACIVFGRGVFVLDEVVVGPGDACFVGAVEAFDAFAAAGTVSKGWEREEGRGRMAYLEITCVIFVSGSEGVPHASMRAWRLVPLPEMRTVMLYLGCAMVSYM